MKRIIVDNVRKKFKIGFKREQTTLARLVSLFSGREAKRVIEALKGVSFSVEAGEVLGIIGENGSGKSTLLRVIAGIYDKDAGKVGVNGKIVSLINLNVGLMERLTMKDNIFLCCSLFGLPQKEINQKLSSIIQFAELEPFLGTKLYQFSEGMKQRLAFSIAIHCNPQILLLDEIFAVGDEDFRKKSADKIKELVKQGISVVLVSHELWMIEKYCDRVIWLEKGKIVKKGKTKEVVKEYVRGGKDEK